MTAGLSHLDFELGKLCVQDLMLSLLSNLNTLHNVAKSRFLFKKSSSQLIPFLAGKFKFNVGIDFIKIEFLDKI